MGASLDAAEGRRILERLATELQRRKITEEEIGRLSRISMWQGLTKNDDGDAEIHDLYGFQLAPSWEDGPEWPVVQQPAPVRVPPVRAKKRSANSQRVTVVLPDQQYGFRRVDDELIPTHDREAIDAALAVTRAAKPDRIVNLGDYVDLPEWSSKFLVTPDFVLTTQPAIDEGYRDLCRQRAICDTVDILEGNHDDRMAIAVARNALAAFGLRRADDPPEAWPVMSVPNLLRVDELGVTYHAGYPANRTKVTKGTDELTPLVAIHGERLDVMKLAKESRQSYIQGHIHRRSEHWETYEVDGRPILVGAISPGALCRIDGAVPSTKSSRTRKRSLTRWESWQQGMAIVTEYDDGSWCHEIVPIHRGQALWRGRVYA